MPDDRGAERGHPSSAETSRLTPAIGRVARRELAANGYTEYEHLTRVSRKQLLAIHGVGLKAVRIIGEELAARGVRFADE